MIQNSYYVNSQGKINEYNSDVNLFSDARFTSLGELKLLPVTFNSKLNKPVLLGEIAEVYEGVREKENISRLNGEEKVCL